MNKVIKAQIYNDYKNNNSALFRVQKRKRCEIFITRVIKLILPFLINSLSWAKNLIETYGKAFDMSFLENILLVLSLFYTVDFISTLQAIILRPSITRRYRARSVYLHMHNIFCIFLEKKKRAKGWKIDEKSVLKSF